MSLTPSFQATALYLFQDGSTDGLFPQNLVLATGGNLYGTIAAGPATSNAGTLYQISTSGAYRLLYALNSGVGIFPSWLMQHTNGLLYGAADGQGANGGGTIFQLDMGLGPFITFVRANGKAEQTAQILGEGLIGATSVTFNGTPATSFKVASNTYLTAVVPAGATSGPVVVTTPKGTLTSNKNFTILP